MAKQFGDRLKELRIENRLTQEELAKRFNTGKSSISTYESNSRTPDLHTITKYAGFFGVTLYYMIGKSDERNSDDELGGFPCSDDKPKMGTELFSERLKNLMFMREITTGALADKLQIDKSKLVKYATGLDIPAPELLRKIAMALDTTADYLLGLVDEIKKPDKKNYPLDILLPDYVEVAKSAQDKKIPAKVISDFIKKCLAGEYE